MSKFEEIHATYADHVVLQCLVQLRKILHRKERSVIAEKGLSAKIKVCQLILMSWLSTTQVQGLVMGYA